MVRKKAVTLIEIIITTTILTLFFVLTFNVVAKKATHEAETTSGKMVCYKDLNGELHQIVSITDDKGEVKTTKGTTCEYTFPENAEFFNITLIGGGGGGGEIVESNIQSDNVHYELPQEGEEELLITDLIPMGGLYDGYGSYIFDDGTNNFSMPMWYGVCCNYSKFQLMYNVPENGIFNECVIPEYHGSTPIKAAFSNPKTISRIKNVFDKYVTVDFYNNYILSAITQKYSDFPQLKVGDYFFYTFEGPAGDMGRCRYGYNGNSYDPSYYLQYYNGKKSTGRKNYGVLKTYKYDNSYLSYKYACRLDLDYKEKIRLYYSTPGEAGEVKTSSSLELAGETINIDANDIGNAGEIGQKGGDTLFRQINETALGGASGVSQKQEINLTSASGKIDSISSGMFYLPTVNTSLNGKISNYITVDNGYTNIANLVAKSGTCSKTDVTCAQGTNPVVDNGKENRTCLGCSGAGGTTVVKIAPSSFEFKCCNPYNYCPIGNSSEDISDNSDEAYEISYPTKGMGGAIIISWE